jgi:hypothetical protein
MRPSGFDDTVLLTNHESFVTSRLPAERRGYGLVESRLAHTALRLACSAAVDEELKRRGLVP